MFFRKNTTRIGVSIGSSSVKVAELKKSGKGYSLVHFGVVQLPEEAIQNKEIVQPAAVVEAIKGIVSDVAGDPDILLTPDLEAGNILAKLLSHLAKSDSAGLVLGARVPIILTSRSDSVRARIASCAIGMLAAYSNRPSVKAAAAPATA